MSLVQGVDYIGDTEEVRRLARNVLPSDFDNDQIKSWQQKTYSDIRTITHKDDWSSTDREFPSLQGYEVRITALEIRKHYGRTSEDRASAINELEAEWKQFNDNIVENMSTATGEEEETIQRTAFKSWNLNSDVEIPTRGLHVF